MFLELASPAFPTIVVLVFKEMNIGNSVQAETSLELVLVRKNKNISIKPVVPITVLHCCTFWGTHPSLLVVTLECVGWRPDFWILPSTKPNIEVDGSNIELLSWKTNPIKII